MDTPASLALGLALGTLIAPPAIWLFEHLGGTLSLPAIAVAAAVALAVIYSH